jgi:hypothetical protein
MMWQRKIVDLIFIVVVIAAFFLARRPTVPKLSPVSLKTIEGNKN